MSSWVVVCRKELSDHLGSRRFLLLFGLILALSLLSAYQGAESVRSDNSWSFLNIFSTYYSGTSFLYLMFMFSPVLGVALGFDAVNRERSQGSLSVLLSQPLFRDSIINGKFLAGVGALSLVSVATVGIMSGVAIPLLGFGPTPDEIMRIVTYTLLTILYLSVWLAIGILFSTVTKKTTTSMLMSVSTWIFSILVVGMVASMIANTIAPTQMPSGMYKVEYQEDGTPIFGFDQAMMEDYQQRMELNHQINSYIQRISPSNLYNEAAESIMNPQVMYISSGNSGAISDYEVVYVDSNLLSTWPQISVLAVVMVACFAASYMLFLRQEIRAGA